MNLPEKAIDRQNSLPPAKQLSRAYLIAICALASVVVFLFGYIRVQAMGYDKEKTVAQAGYNSDMKDLRKELAACNADKLSMERNYSTKYIGMVQEAKREALEFVNQQFKSREERAEKIERSNARILPAQKRTIQHLEQLKNLSK